MGIRIGERGGGLAGCLAIVLLGLPAVSPGQQIPPVAPMTTGTAVETTPDRPIPTSPPLIRDADLSFFFPPTRTASNAAAAYTRAVEVYLADPERTRAQGKPELLIRRESVLAALDLITSGARCRSCDFLPFLPDDLSKSTKFPHTLETQTLARVLRLRFNTHLAAGDQQAALATARTLMAFGQHLRASALVLGQEIQGIAVERLALTSFRKTLAFKADAVTSAKIVVVQRLLDGAQDYIADQVTSHAAAGRGFTADRAWLRSAHPVLRCEAILNMAKATLPSSVLIKPTPSLSLNDILRKIEEAKPGSTVTLRREEFETKIKWPRKGVRRGITAEDARALRELIEPLATSDPDRRARVLAQRLLDSLGEPSITVAPPRRPARPTTGTLRRYPPPRRPPGLRPPRLRPVPTQPR